MSTLEHYAQIVAGEKIPGDVVEIGVAAGKSIVPLRWIFPSEKKVYGYDTFSGMPKEVLIPGEEHLESIGKDLPTGIVETLRGKGITPVVGVFPESICANPSLFPEKICFAHIDVDNFLTTDQALGLVWPRLQDGGVIAVHDFHNSATPGVTKSVEDFLATKSGAVASNHVEHLIIRRVNGLGPESSV